MGFFVKKQVMSSAIALGVLLSGGVVNSAYAKDGSEIIEEVDDMDILDSSDTSGSEEVKDTSEKGTKAEEKKKRIEELKKKAEERKKKLEEKKKQQAEKKKAKEEKLKQTKETISQIVKDVTPKLTELQKNITTSSTNLSNVVTTLQGLTIPEGNEELKNRYADLKAVQEKITKRINYIVTQKDKISSALSRTTNVKVAQKEQERVQKLNDMLSLVNKDIETFTSEVNKLKDSISK